MDNCSTRSGYSKKIYSAFEKVISSGCHSSKLLTFSVISAHRDSTTCSRIEIAKKTLEQSKKLSDVLEMECNRIVKEFDLTRKGWVNAKTILIGMFEYAKRKKYITENPLLDMKITVRYKQVVKKPGSTQTYNTEELEALNHYLDKMYQETEDTAFPAVRLNFFLGLRVRELVALKPEDIFENQVHVVREEVRDQESNRCYVAEHTQTNIHIYIYITH